MEVAHKIVVLVLKHMAMNRVSSIILLLKNFIVLVDHRKAEYSDLARRAIDYISFWHLLRQRRNHVSLYIILNFRELCTFLQPSDRYPSINLLEFIEKVIRYFISSHQLNSYEVNMHWMCICRRVKDV
jgi:hypothetical protein